MIEYRAIVATAFLSCIFVTCVVANGAGPPVALAQTVKPQDAQSQHANVELLQRMNLLQERVAALEKQGPKPGQGQEPPKTVLLPIKGAGENIPGMVNEMYLDVLKLKQQVKSLEEQVASLQQQLKTDQAAQQVALQKLQTAFTNHFHDVATEPAGRKWSTMIGTPLYCPGANQPALCQEGAPNWLTFQYGNGQPDRYVPATGYQTSGPIEK